MHKKVISKWVPKWAPHRALAPIENERRVCWNFGCFEELQMRLAAVGSFGLGVLKVMGVFACTFGSIGTFNHFWEGKELWVRWALWRV